MSWKKKQASQQEESNDKWTTWYKYLIYNLTMINDWAVVISIIFIGTPKKWHRNMKATIFRSAEDSTLTITIYVALKSNDHLNELE